MFKKSKKSTLVDALAGAMKPLPTKKSHKKRNMILGALGVVGSIAAGNALKKNNTP